jgi:hypothetical protein
MQVLMMMDATARDEDSIARAQFLLPAIDSDRQDTLEPIKEFVCVLMVVGRGHAGVRRHNELKYSGAALVDDEAQFQLSDPYDIGLIRFQCLASFCKMALRMNVKWLYINVNAYARAVR